MPQPERAAPSAWVARWAAVLVPNAHVLDVAAGGGRHSVYFADRGCQVEAVDRDVSALEALASPRIRVRQANLEAAPWPYPGWRFDAIVVAHYLHRPLFPDMLRALAPGGVLIYETFMLGNERFGRPSNPDFLLRPNELLELAKAGLVVLGFEQGYRAAPAPAMMQAVCARRPA